MQILNATPWASPNPALIPPLKCTDRGFWQPSIDPAAGGTLPDGAAIPELSRPRLAGVCEDVVKNFGGRLVFDVESATLAASQTDPDVFADRLALLTRLATCAKTDGVTSVGFYGIPIGQEAEKQYRATLDLWVANSRALSPAIAMCDALYPVAYAGQRGAGGGPGGGSGGASGGAPAGAPIDYGVWCSLVAYQVTTAMQLWPGKPIWPFVSGRAGFEGTSGNYLEKPDFVRRLAFLRSLPIAGVVYWDAAFAGETWSTLDQMPLYTQLYYAATYDPTWPADGPNWLK